MHYNSRLRINLQAIVENWKYLCAEAPNANIGAVLKADAYGLGAVPIAKALYQAGCQTFFVAYAVEGAILRPLVLDATIFVLQGIPCEESLNLCIQNRLIPVLNSFEQFKLWEAACKSLNPCPPASLNIDSGIHRNGLDLISLQKINRLTNGFETLSITHYFSHLASSEQIEDPYNQVQLNRFLAAIQSLPPRLLSLANSYGIFLGPPYHMNLIRSGTALYGALRPNISSINFKNAISFESKVIQVFDAPQGETIGYNQTHILNRNSRLMCIAAGYADGLMRSLSNKGKFYLNEYELPILGRVCMGCTVVDATDIPEKLCFSGQWLTLTNSIPNLLTLAQDANTTIGEIFINLSKGGRTQRIYIN